MCIQPNIRIVSVLVVTFERAKMTKTRRLKKIAKPGCIPLKKSEATRRAHLFRAASAERIFLDAALRSVPDAIFLKTGI
ncbi:MAG TPA: hypothetical protein VE868_02750 [Balneolaceae bacterium]|nr:hypothetical protein [Balneolaceae bacterium]